MSLSYRRGYFWFWFLYSDLFQVLHRHSRISALMSLSLWLTYCLNFCCF